MTRCPPTRDARRPRFPAGCRRLASGCLLLAALAGLAALPALPAAAAAAPAPAAAPRLILESVELQGATRTSTATVLRLLDLVPGQPITQAELAGAVAALRARHCFDAVDYYTRPGSARGAVVLVLEVRERGIGWRLGTGQSDLDGWYVTPLELNLDNRFGHGEELGARFKFGYRQAGFDAHLRRGLGPRDHWRWGLDADMTSSERVYFLAGVEYAHQVDRSQAGVRLGRRLAAPLWLDLGLRVETTKADSTGEVWQDNDVVGVSQGDEVRYDELPAGIAAAVGRRNRGLVRLDLELDTREGSRAGSPAHGWWGRLRAQRTTDDAGDFTTWSADLRAYRPAPGGVFALRLGAGGVDAAAPFYDRLYLGGLYTVRGVPSQSLSRPEGGTWLWHTSLEYRAALVGPVERPRLAGDVFFDAGQGGGPGERPRLDDVATSLGWGLRYRLGSFWIGTDFGVPLRDSPVDEAFHGHAALGWSF